MSTKQLELNELTDQIHQLFKESDVDRVDLEERFDRLRDHSEEQQEVIDGLLGLLNEMGEAYAAKVGRDAFYNDIDRRGDALLEKLNAS